MKNKYLTTFAMVAIAFSPLFVMKAASLTDLSQNYRIPTDVDINIESDSELDNDLDEDGNDGEDVEVNSSADASISGELMRVTREDIESGVSVETNLSADAVANESDLRAFALGAMQDDENIDSMSFDSDEVTVSYKDNGRFVGIFPVVMNVDVTVDQEGEVDFDYPWFGFLVMGDKGDLETLIEAEVEAALALEAEDGWTNYDRARLAASIVAALKAHPGASTATTTDAEV